MSSMSILIDKPVDRLSEHVTTTGLDAGLALLLEGHECATSTQRPLWEFALEQQTLLQIGMTNSQLRTLLCAGYVKHGIEENGGAKKRGVRATAGLRITIDSCFILTTSGVELARRHAHPAAVAVVEAKPSWQQSCLQLRFGGELVKHFRRPAPSQIAILVAFEQKGWPHWVTNPLPLDFDSDVAERLHDTIKRLNRCHKKRLLRFRGDGLGKGVLWERVVKTK